MHEPAKNRLPKQLSLSESIRWQLEPIGDDLKVTITVPQGTDRTTYSRAISEVVTDIYGDRSPPVSRVLDVVKGRSAETSNRPESIKTEFRPVDEDYQVTITLSQRVDSTTFTKAADRVISEIEQANIGDATPYSFSTNYLPNPSSYGLPRRDFWN